MRHVKNDGIGYRVLAITMLGLQAICVMAACVVETNKECVPLGESHETTFEEGGGVILNNVWYGDIYIAVANCNVEDTRDADPYEYGFDNPLSENRSCSATADYNASKVAYDDQGVAYIDYDKYPGAGALTKSCPTSIVNGEACTGPGYGS